LHLGVRPCWMDFERILEAFCVAVCSYQLKFLKGARLGAF
jgi:hypothetical protein